MQGESIVYVGVVLSAVSGIHGGGAGSGNISPVDKGGALLHLLFGFHICLGLQ